MIGVSLPFHWLLYGSGAPGNQAKVLETLKAHSIGSVELRTVAPDTNPSDTLRAARMLWERGFAITVHASVRSPESAVTDVFAPLAMLLDASKQKSVTITIHPIVSDNAAMLTSLADYAVARGWNVVLALENNRLLPDKSEGDAAALVLAAVKAVGRPNVGICFDMGHYLYYVKKNHPNTPDMLPPREFFRHVVHTHIHAVKELHTHFPLHEYELPLARYVGALCHGYFGVYNLELDFPRFAEFCEPIPALTGSIDTLASVMPHCARLYDDIRRNFDARFMNALSVFDKPGCHFSLIHASSYLFNTHGFHWAMDVSFRNAYQLADTPHHAASLLSGLKLMIISHEHDDHFEERTIRALASSGMKWIVPEFLADRALSFGIRSETLITAHAGEKISVGPLTLLPFESRHFRPVNRKGVPEYGYHISAEGAPSIVFPVDVRDYSPDRLPSLPPADVCFAHVWLGDDNTAPDCPALANAFAKFMLKFSTDTIFLTHLYENGRKDSQMWRREHAELAAAAIHAANPDTRIIIPEMGDAFEL